MLSLNKEYHERLNKFISYVETTLKPKSLSEKLKKYYELEFGEFTKELAKQKVVLTKKDEFELMELFEEQKKKTLELKNTIDKTDAEIDKMVYELYGLTEEEKKIVEESVGR